MSVSIIDRIKNYAWDKKVKKIQSSIPYEEAIWLEELCIKSGEKEATVIALIINEADKADIENIVAAFESLCPNLGGLDESP
jgi:hypothetical protein